MKKLMDYINKKEKEIKKMVELEFTLLKFELAIACIPKKERDRTTKAVQEYRKEHWAKALKKAKGDINKAYKIYCED